MKIFKFTVLYRTLTSKTTKTPIKSPQNMVKSMPKSNLTPQQSHILDAIANRQSVFITGSAGTGKTLLLKQITTLLKKIYSPSRVSVTASTGVAACALNGQTLHSFAGIGAGALDRDALLQRVTNDKFALKRWKRVRALVIDEISVIDAELFDNLEFIARVTRDKLDVTWGGIQLIVSGDFFQLPPVIDYKDSNWCGREFAFEAKCWECSFDLQEELSRVFRQTEKEFVKLLQGIRIGEIDDEDMKVIAQCYSSVEPCSSVVKIYPRNREVKKENVDRMRSLGKEIVTFKAIDTGPDCWIKQLDSGLVPNELEACVGARVMLIKNLNMERKLVNGATGTITGFYKPKVDKWCLSKISSIGAMPEVKFDSTGSTVRIKPVTWEVGEGDVVLATRKQIPLVLAWALSIHKCQGMTLDRVHTDLSRSFCCGMAYVAISRVKSLAGLHLSGFNPSNVKTHPKVLEFSQNFGRKKDFTREDDDGLHLLGD